MRGAFLKAANHGAIFPPTQASALRDCEISPETDSHKGTKASCACLHALCLRAFVGDTFYTVLDSLRMTATFSEDFPATLLYHHSQITGQKAGRHVSGRVGVPPAVARVPHGTRRLITGVPYASEVRA